MFFMPTSAVGRLRRRAVTAVRLPAASQRIAGEALLELVRARLLVQFVPWPRYVATLGERLAGDPCWEWEGDGRLLRDVRWAIDRWSSEQDARFTCLMRAIASQRMLARRRVAAAVVLGARPDAAPASPASRASQRAAAHAWVRVGQYVVVGATVKPSFAGVAQFRRGPVSPQSR